jgi:hypothetical protein
MYNCLNFIDYFNRILIISLRSLLRFTFNPYGVGASPRPFPRFHLGLLSRSARYCVSTPLGLGPSPAIPQVSPGANHIQPLWGWGPSPAFPQVFLKLFTFNPFAVGALHGPPQVFPKLFRYQIESIC